MGDDGQGDLVLDVEDVAIFAVEPLRPEVHPRPGVDELGRDAEEVPGLANAALEDGPDAQLPSDLADVELHVLEGERGRAGHDPDPLEAGQGVDELLGQSFAEIIVVLGRAHVGEGKDGHGGHGVLGVRFLAAQGFRHALKIGKALRGALAEALEDHRFQSRRDLGSERRGAGRILVQDLVRDGPPLFSGERAPSGRHLEEGAAEGPDVGPPVRPLAPDLFGRHVRGRAQDRLGAGQVGPAFDRGQAEIHDPGLSLAVDHDVGGLDVPVDHAFFVRGLEPRGDLGRDPERFVDRQGPFRDPLFQAPALDESHGQEHLPFGFVDLEDRADVGMVEDGGGLGLAQEAFLGLGVLADLGGQELEGDRPAELRVLGLEDDAHPAAADDIQKMIPAADHPAAEMSVGNRAQGACGVRRAGVRKDHARPAAGTEAAVGAGFESATGAAHRFSRCSFLLVFYDFGDSQLNHLIVSNGILELKRIRQTLMAPKSTDRTRSKPGRSRRGG